VKLAEWTSVDGRQFDLQEFAERWRRARLSALGEPASVGLDPGQELRAILAAGERTAGDVAARDAVLKAVFDASRKLGLSLSRFFRIQWESADFGELLPWSGVPCFQFDWVSRSSGENPGGAHVATRPGCEAGRAAGAIACDFWREALDGLVMGLGDEARFARHRSVGHGDAECLDIVFEERSSGVRAPRGARDGATRFGTVDPEVHAALAGAIEKFRAMKVKLRLEGVSEGVLYYQLDADEGVLCGAGGALLHQSLEREAARAVPHLKLKDTAPIAVYGGSS